MDSDSDAEMNRIRCCKCCNRSVREGAGIVLPKSLWGSVSDQGTEIWEKKESVFICQKCATKTDNQTAEDFWDFNEDSRRIADLEQKLQVAKAEREKKAKALGLHLNTFGKFVRKVNK